MNGIIARHRVAALGAIALVFASLTGCYPVRRAEPIVGPIALQDPNLQNGRKLFDQYCYRCHTQGEGGMGPIINDKPLPKFLMRLQVRAGLGAMPSFPKDAISDEDLGDILDYIVALRHHH